MIGTDRFQPRGLRAGLIALGLWGLGCVAPVSPQFEDPAGNLPPFVADSTPTAGAVLPLTQKTFSVTLGDPNLDDQLVARWLIDYPPYDASVSRAGPEVRLPTTGQVNREPIRFAPSCADENIATDSIWHRVTVSAADRPFLDPDLAASDLPWDSVPAEGFVVRATWIVYLKCGSSP
jgi:hypothetical protein